MDLIDKMNKYLVGESFKYAKEPLEKIIKALDKKSTDYKAAMMIKKSGKFNKEQADWIMQKAKELKV